jgi:chromosomal replication initiator protein
MKSFKNIWDATVLKLSEKITPNAMDLWIRPAEPIGYENNAAIIMVESPFQRDIIMSRYRDDIREALLAVSGIDMDVNAITQEERNSQKAHVQKSAEYKVDTKLHNIEENLTSEYTFDNFIVGDSNRHAHAACYAVAKNPAFLYNPLFLYGNTGLGKTHLLNAIKNEIRKLYPSYRVVYVSCEEFTNDFIEHLKNKTTAEFKEKYRTADVLLIDDIQFISGKDQTQTEFFHTFNALYEDKKQIIIASDRPPKEIPQLEERLRSRFESGLMTDIIVPEYELKVAVLKQKAAAYSITIPDDVLFFIASKIKNNIRQLDGVVKKIKAFQLVSDTTPNIALAQSAIRDITNENEPLPVILDKILLAVSRDFNVTPEDIKSSKRQEAIVTARQVAMYIIRDMTAMSLPDIGMEFNGRDHSTVHHAVYKIEAKMNETASFATRINNIINEIKNN